MAPNFVYNPKGSLVIFLAALPGSGKTSLAHALVQIFGEDQTVLYFWGKQAAEPAIRERYGACTMDEVESFFNEIELNDPLAVEAEFLVRTDVLTTNAKFIIIDGIKNQRQLQAIATALNLSWILITTFREDETRVADAKKRGEADDDDDARRLAFVTKMGLPQLIATADFSINNTGFVSDYSLQDRWFDLHYPVCYLETFHELMWWLNLSQTKTKTRQLILNANERALHKHGFQTITCEVITE